MKGRKEEHSEAVAAQGAAASLPNGRSRRRVLLGVFVEQTRKLLLAGREEKPPITTLEGRGVKGVPIRCAGVVTTPHMGNTLQGLRVWMGATDMHLSGTGQSGERITGGWISCGIR